VRRLGQDHAPPRDKNKKALFDQCDISPPKGDPNGWSPGRMENPDYATQCGAVPAARITPTDSHIAAAGQNNDAGWRAGVRFRVVKGHAYG
jgi:hypothetical protein